VLARRLGVVRPWLRRLDSATDLIFYLCVLVAATSLEPLAVRSAAPGIVLLLLSEGACITISLWRFGVLPATHSYSAKLYGLVLWIVWVGVLAFGWGARAIWALTAVGLIANLEVILILLRSSTPPVDVSSVWALRTRER
jgi:CDP-diacylglycerol--glycerol-3-phosphate 3-phosphatidyltransferase